MLTKRICITLISLSLLAWPSRADRPQSDYEITRSLEQAMDRDFRLRETKIQFSTVGGSVTLRGTVSTYMDRDAVERLAKRTSGVTSVSNMIDVDSMSIDDQRVSEDILGRLARSGFVRAVDVNVRVKGGVVTLTGSVRSWEESQQAERVTSEVRGVRHVINELMPPSSSLKVPDDQLKADIESKLAHDAYLAGYAIDVTVDSGLVRLAGEVPNLFHKERADNQAESVPGVRSIDSQLVVVSQAILQSLPALPNDAELQRSVYDELRADPRVNTEGLDVVASRGEIDLLGQIDSMFGKRTAERVAQRVFGVARVSNQLTVNPAKRRDEQILADIRSNLASDAMLDGQTINVTVSGGTAILSGDVKSNAVKYHALRIVSRVAGVSEITNNLQVAISHPVSDESIKQYIQEGLAANAITRPIAQRIEVTVDQGNVVLSGHVNRWAESIEAIRIARATTGTQSVENRIQRQP